MKVMIVESPAKAKKIAGFLGEGWRVLASMGHVRDLPVKDLGVDVEADFRPTYAIVSGKGRLVKRLVQAIVEAEAVYVATDPDREGEAIAWHVLKVADLPKDKRVYRVTFSAITKAAVLAAIATPRPLDIQLIDAQETRRIVDRLVGYLTSPLACQSLNGRYSAGRVQSACLRLIVERERAIAAFEPETYWILALNLQADDQIFQADLHQMRGSDIRFTDRTPLKKLVNLLQSTSVWVSHMARATHPIQPPPPFTTATLQQVASRRLNIAPDRVMDVAQHLYEAGMITYHRTDGVSVAPEAQLAARAFITLTYGERYLPAESPIYQTKSVSAQEAHEAIRPTDVSQQPTDVTEDGAGLYRLIWERFVASQMAAGQVSVTVVDIQVGKSRETPYPVVFRAKGRVGLFDGFQRVYQDEDEPSHTPLPDLSIGQSLQLVESVVDEKQTRAPAHFNAASMVAALEQDGIGRPSTYASTIKLLLDKGYVGLHEKHLKPSEQGEALCDYLVAHFPTVFDVAYTAELEANLDRVATGEITRSEVLKSFWAGFHPHLQSAAKQAAAHLQTRHTPAIPLGERCPTCGGELLSRQGSRGAFIGCGNFPKCTYTRGLVEAQPLHLQSAERVQS